jgi:hypothetical protein
MDKKWAWGDGCHPMPTRVSPWWRQTTECKVSTTDALPCECNGVTILKLSVVGIHEGLLSTLCMENSESRKTR